MKARLVAFIAVCGLLTANGMMVAIPPAAAQVSAEIVIGRAPPPPRAEVVPGPRPGWVWEPGVWVWNGHEHVWRAGHWIHERPGWHRVPAEWVQGPNGWRFVPAHWAR